MALAVTMLTYTSACQMLTHRYSIVPTPSELFDYPHERARMEMPSHRIHLRPDRFHSMSNEGSGAVMNISLHLLHKHNDFILKTKSDMNKVVVVFEAETMQPAQYRAIIRDLEAAGAGAPAGRLHHVAAIKGSGMLVVDTFESQELLDQFAAVLVPIIIKNGVTPPEPQVYPIDNIIVGEEVVA